MKVKVKGMNCQSCVRKINKRLKELKIKRIKVSLFDESVSFKENKKVSLLEVKQAISDLGFTVE